MVCLCAAVADGLIEENTSSAVCKEEIGSCCDAISVGFELRLSPRNRGSSYEFDKWGS